MKIQTMTHTICFRGINLDPQKDTNGTPDTDIKFPPKIGTPPKRYSFSDRLKLVPEAFENILDGVGMSSQNPESLNYGLIHSPNLLLKGFGYLGQVVLWPTFPIVAIATLIAPNSIQIAVNLRNWSRERAAKMREGLD